MTAICVPIFIKSGTDLEAAITEAEDALAGMAPGKAMLELRCDTASSRQLSQAIDLARLPVIVTIRPTWEGGHSDKTDDQRIALWEEAMDLDDDGGRGPDCPRDDVFGGQMNSACGREVKQ